MYQEFKSPISAQLEITSGCNHKCIHCYNHWREPNDNIGTLTREDIHKIILNLRDSEVYNLTLTGGEPLLFPELIFETIHLAKSSNIHCSINSNISYLTDEIAHQLSGMDVRILTSFPSHNPTTFDAIVRKRGAHEQTVRGVHIAHKNNLGISANMVVMQNNKDDVYETGKFVNSLGVKSFSATKVHPSQTCSDFSALQISAQEVISIFDDLLRLRQDFGMYVDTLMTYPLCLFKDMDRYGDLLLHRNCSAGKANCTIGPDGGVRPCSHSDEIYGNAITESLLDIWPRLREWRDGTYIPDECKACKWLKQCGAACRMDSKYFHGRKDKPDPYMTVGNNQEIIMTNRKPTPTIDIDQLFTVNSNVRLKREKFGTIAVTKKGAPILTEDSANLISSLQHRAFTIREIINIHNIEMEFAKIFFGKLLYYDVLVERSSQNQ